jgi:hypothetical protein
MLGGPAFLKLLPPDSRFNEVLPMGEDEGDYFDRLVDPKVRCSLEAAEVGERLEANIKAREAASRSASGLEPLFRSIQIAGLGSPWSTASAESVCSGCWGVPLRFLGYCSKCDRCGFDHLISPLPKKLVKPMAACPKDDGLADGTGTSVKGTGGRRTSKAKASGKASRKARATA